MTTLSVVHYNTSPHKLNILQQTTNNNDRREIIILRKTQNILPQPKEYNKEDILITNTAKKKIKSSKEVRNNPQPLAVARRNARERNRVKQVNNGFANLRQHIPNFIAAAFESTSGRNGNKKLSKVETLRMAVEYIRSLEEILASDDNSESGNISNSSLSSSNTNGVAYSYPTVLSPSADEDDLSTNPTPPPQYIRINTTNNTYQIIPNHLYDDSENLEPLNVDEHILSDPSLMDANIEFNGVQDLSLLNNESLSPEMYSEQSLSPDYPDKPKRFIPIFSNQNEEIKVKLSQIKTEQDLPVISLKNDHELSQHGNVIDVIQWWEEQQKHHVS